MAVSYGYFDGKYSNYSYDRLYSSAQISELFEGVITDGVYLNWKGGSIKIGETTYTWKPGIMAVKKINNDDYPRSIYVEPGKAWYKGTWTINPDNLVIDIAEEYSNESLYAVNDLCTYKASGETKYKLYKCKTAITSVESWTAAHWDEIVAPVSSTDKVIVEMAVVLEVNKSSDVRENSIIAKLKTDIHHTTNIDDYVLAYIDLEVTKDHPEGFIKDYDINNVVGTAESPYFAWLLQDLDVSAVIEKWTIILGRVVIPFISWFSVMQEMLDPAYENNRYGAMYPVLLRAYSNPYVDNLLPRVEENTVTTFDGVADGNKKTFTISGTISSISNVRVNGSKVPYSASGNSFTFIDAPAAGSIITARVVPVLNLYGIYFDATWDSQHNKWIF